MKRATGWIAAHADRKKERRMEKRIVSLASALNALLNSLTSRKFIASATYILLLTANRKEKSVETKVISALLLKQTSYLEDVTKLFLFLLNSVPLLIYGIKLQSSSFNLLKSFLLFDYF